MDWANERYVRIFTRKTADHAVLCWQARALWPLVMCAADRCGVIATKHGPRGLAALLDMPREFVDAGLPELIADGCIREIADGAGYVIPNYLSAQETVQSDRQRKKEERERRRAVAMAAEIGCVTKPDADVTKRDIESRNVTPESRGVTRSHRKSLRAVPCRAVISEAEQNQPQPPPEPLAPLASGARARDPSTPVLVPVPAPPAPQVDPDPRATERRRVLNAVSRIHRTTFERVRKLVASDARPMAVVGDPAERALQTHLASLVTLDDAEDDCLHVLAVREAEALRTGSVQYLGASVWNVNAFARAKAMTVAEARSGPKIATARHDPQSALDRQLARVAMLERQELEAASQHDALDVTA